MLAGKGFKKVFNVSGGIKAWEAKTAVGPQDSGLDLFTGNEAPTEILKVAYSLEQGLNRFYLDMENKAQNKDVKALFLKLSEIEEKHKEEILAAYADIAGETVDKEAFEKTLEAKVLEGGLTVDEYLARFNADLEKEKEVLSLAMSIEAQALDLYQRVAGKIDNETSKTVVNRIANEEKAHLGSLGELMDTL